MQLNERCTYKPHPVFGEMLPIVLYWYTDKFGWIAFHISKTDYAKLNGGEGRCYGRTESGPWRALRIFRFRVLNHQAIKDPLVLVFLKREEEEYFEMMKLLGHSSEGRK